MDQLLDEREGEQKYTQRLEAELEDNKQLYALYHLMCSAL
jgi:hypothetical protein